MQVLTGFPTYLFCSFFIVAHLNSVKQKRLSKRMYLQIFILC